MKVKWLKGKLKEVELEMEEYICEPEQGEILGETEDENLKIETSSEAKGSHGFKTNNLYMYAGETCKEGQLYDIVIKEEEDKQNPNSVLEEDEIDRSHMQLEEYVKQPSEGLEEIEEETIKEFLNHMNNLEQQGDMMVEPSSETIGSYIFKTNSLCMMVDIAGEKQPFEDIFRGDEDLEAKGDKENFSEEEEIDYIQKEKSMDESIEAVIEENDNTDDGTKITMGEQLQRDSKAKCTEKEETMLAENIVKDQKFTMMTSIVEIAMKVVEIVNEEEELLLKYVKE